MSVHIKLTSNGWARILGHKFIMVTIMTKYFSPTAIALITTTGLAIGIIEADADTFDFTDDASILTPF